MNDRSLRVLVVDDDSGARLLHGRYVEETPGFQLAARVGTGLGAIEHAARLDVDLVLLDVRLPDISGIEVLHRLRTLGLGRIGRSVVREDRPEVRGMITTVAHLVTVEEVD